MSEHDTKQDHPGAEWVEFQEVADWEAQEDEWLPDQSRDDLARVFVAVLDRWRREGGGLTEERFDKALIWQRLWFLALTDPRAALCQLLDLLNIPVPEGLTQ
jgi:hypothetical protein